VLFTAKAEDNPPDHDNLSEVLRGTQILAKSFLFKNERFKGKMLVEFMLYLDSEHAEAKELKKRIKNNKNVWTYQEIPDEGVRYAEFLAETAEKLPADTIEQYNKMLLFYVIAKKIDNRNEKSHQNIVKAQKKGYECELQSLLRREANLHKKPPEPEKSKEPKPDDPPKDNKLNMKASSIAKAMKKLKYKEFFYTVAYPFHFVNDLNKKIGAKTDGYAVIFDSERVVIHEQGFNYENIYWQSGRTPPVEGKTPHHKFKYATLEEILTHFTIMTDFRYEIVKGKILLKDAVESDGKLVPFRDPLTARSLAKEFKENFKSKKKYDKHLVQLKGRITNVI